MCESHSHSDDGLLSAPSCLDKEGRLRCVEYGLFSQLLEQRFLCGIVPGTRSSSSDRGVTMGVEGVTLISGMCLPCSCMAVVNVSSPALALAVVLVMTLAVVVSPCPGDATTAAVSSSLTLVELSWLCVRLRVPGLCLGSLTGIPLVADVDMYCVDVAAS